MKLWARLIRCSTCFPLGVSTPTPPLGGRTRWADAEGGRVVWTRKVDALCGRGRWTRCVDAEGGRVVWTRKVDAAVIYNTPIASAFQRGPGGGRTRCVDAAVVYNTPISSAHRLTRPHTTSPPSAFRLLPNASAFQRGACGLAPILRGTPLHYTQYHSISHTTSCLRFGR